MGTWFQNRLPLACLIQVKIIAMVCWHRLGKLICTHQRPWVNIQAPSPHKWTGCQSARTDSSQLTQVREKQSRKSWLQSYRSLWPSQDRVIQQLWHWLPLVPHFSHLITSYFLFLPSDLFRGLQAPQGSGCLFWCRVISPLQQSLIGQI